jgi:hypothetical protein
LRARLQAARDDRTRRRTSRRKEHSMMDVILLALAFGLFAVSVGYTIACDRL